MSKSTPLFKKGKQTTPLISIVLKYPLTIIRCDYVSMGWILGLSSYQKKNYLGLSLEKNLTKPAHLFIGWVGSDC